MSALVSAAAISSALLGAAVLLSPGRRGRFRAATGHALQISGQSSARAARDGLHGGRADSGARRGPGEELQRASLLVAQISALLRAGRSPVQLWAQAAALHERQSRQAWGVRVMHSGGSAPQQPSAWLSRSFGRPVPMWDEASSRILASAAHAASFGRPVGDAIRSAAGAVEYSKAVRHRGGGSHAASVWRSIAACIDTAEASGSPLAAVLDRLAAQFEADADAAAARAVALAGPTATAKVLSVLPLAGLGLGILMGVDPLGLLLSTPLGGGCLVLGTILTLVGRWWSSRLVRAASEER